jgi:hypothetical protein
MTDLNDTVKDQALQTALRKAFEEANVNNKGPM